MKTITVKAERTYDVQIDCDYAQHITEATRDRARAAVIISDSMKDKVAQFPSLECEFHYFYIPDGEAGKSIETIKRLWDWLGAAGFTRSDVVIAIGGGAITDVAGFAASTWLRGIDWIAVPTTVAGMVDAAIGGKTGINSDYGKNLIGAFYSPLSVVIDLQWLETLSDRDFAAGLAEVVKCGFIADPLILEALEGKSLSEIRKDSGVVLELIIRSVAVKASVVSEDFKEGFAREALNYGHTFGHAIEIAHEYSLRHGEAVSIGMVFIAELSYLQGLISQDIRDRHISILTGLGLPVTVRKDDSHNEWLRLKAAMKMDKKNRGNSLRFVALDGIGATQRLEDVNEDILFQSYERVLS